MSIFEKQLSKLEQFISGFPPVYSFLKKCKVRYQRLKYILLQFTDRNRDVIYNRSFFDKNLVLNVPIAPAMADIMMKYFQPHSVVDVGCGNAEFLLQFQRKGVEIKGYDGSRHAIESALVDRKFIELFDLRDRIKYQQKYNVALCLEVAEHIEKKFSKRLIENLTNLSDTVIFTAAPPGQGGHFHINEQPREFWKEIFKERNFIYDSEITKKIKSEMEKEKNLRWYCENLMVFKKQQ